MRGKKKLLTLLAIFFLIMSAQAILFNVSEEASAYTPHDPIYINGNADFTPTNGVTGGSGTLSDPYIMEGWEINASTTNGIEIGNTDAYIFVHDLYLYSYSSTYYGIDLHNVQNCRIENVRIENNSIGIILYESSGNIIANSTVSSNDFDGIHLGYSGNNTIASNIVSSNIWDGINIYQSSGNTITNNIVSNNDKVSGIHLDASSTNIIANNFISNNNFGIYIWASESNIVTNNTALSNEYGIHIYYLSDSNTLTNNTVSYNDYGIYVGWGSTGNRIYYSNIINNLNQSYDDTANDNQWDDGYPSGGNYWTDYTGIDKFKGPNQDQMGNDGIGDTPYVIDSDSKDNYPLMEPTIPYNTSPFASFAVTPSSGVITTIFNMDASSTSDLDDPTTSLEVRWDWEDDGVWDTSWSTTKTAQHQYANSGTFTIRLGVRDSGGLTDTATNSVVVLEAFPDDGDKLLVVPYNSQGETKWCFPNAIAMVLQYYGKNVHMWDIADAWGLNNQQGIGSKYQFEKYEDMPYAGQLGLGIHGNFVREYVTRFGLDASDPYVVEVMNFDFYKSRIDQGQPIIFTSVKAEHAGVVVGYREDDAGQYLYFHSLPHQFNMEWEQPTWSSDSKTFTRIRWESFREYFEDDNEKYALVIFGGEGGGRSGSFSHPRFWDKSNPYSNYHGPMTYYDCGVKWVLEPISLQESKHVGFPSLFLGDELTLGIWVSNPTSTVQEYQLNVHIKEFFTGENMFNEASSKILLEPYQYMFLTYETAIGDTITLDSYANGWYVAYLGLWRYGTDYSLEDSYDFAGPFIFRVDEDPPLSSPWIEIVAYSPVNLLITDQSGRQTGIVDGTFVTDIPDSVILSKDHPEAYLVRAGEEMQVSIKGERAGTYSVEVVQYLSDSTCSFSFVHLQTAPGQTDELRVTSLFVGVVVWTDQVYAVRIMRIQEDRASLFGIREMEQKTGFSYKYSIIDWNLLPVATSNELEGWFHPSRPDGAEVVLLDIFDLTEEEESRTLRLKSDYVWNTPPHPQLGTISMWGWVVLILAAASIVAILFFGRKRIATRIRQRTRKLSENDQEWNSKNQ